MIVWPHQGLGDHILCNGLYRVLSERGTVVLPVLEKDALAVEFMLSDTNVEVLPFKTEDAINEWCSKAERGNPNLLRIGNHNRTGFNRWLFDQEFYRQARVDFMARWERFYIPPSPQFEDKWNDLALVHDRPELGCSIPTQHNEYRPKNIVPLWAYRKAIQQCRELHCVSSSFAALADSYDLGRKPLFFYSFGREIPRHRNHWQYRELRGSVL